MSSSDLDGRAATQAIFNLLSLDPVGISRLADFVSPDDFDAFLWLRATAASYGFKTQPFVIKRLRDSDAMMRALLLDWLRFSPSAQSLAAVLKLASDRDWRVRAQAASILGAWLDDEKGEEMGRLEMLRLGKAICSSSMTIDASEWDDLGRRTLGDFYSILSLNPSFSSKDRLALLSASPNPFDSAGRAAAAEFVAQIRARAAGDCKVFARQTRWAAAQKTGIRKILRQMTRDSDPDVRASALLALGGIGDGADADRIGRFLSSGPAIDRTAAAFALGKMGPAASSAISRLLLSADESSRIGGALAAARSWNPHAFLLLSRALSDKAAAVRLSAAADVIAATTPVFSVRRELIPKLLKMRNADPSRAVRLAAAAAVAAIGP